MPVQVGPKRTLKLPDSSPWLSVLELASSSASNEGGGSKAEEGGFELCSSRSMPDATASSAHAFPCRSVPGPGYVLKQAIAGYAYVRASCLGVSQPPPPPPPISDWKSLRYLPAGCRDTGNLPPHLHSRSPLPALRPSPVSAACHTIGQCLQPSNCLP